MRILVLSDIHANLTALEAVLSDAGTVDGVWCLGDVVGYGPDPNECVARIRMLPDAVCLLGNHDSAALGRIPIETFNQDARRSIEWIQNVLTKETFAFLAKLPERVVIDQVTLVHGSPRNPVWEYILDMHNANQNLSYFDTPICMVGHTHLPIAYISADASSDLRWTVPPEGEKITIEARAILNPGSVGQPRDHDPRASYAIFTPQDNGWEIRRVEYDIRAVQKRIRAADLPMRHALRLIEGW
jgi:diadenosine tetraphosphatase ApaH/serine/threonine PP2A family protein phosphatase